MSLKTKHKEIEFGIGDTVRVIQKIEEGGKKRMQAFEGIVIAIKGREDNKSFTVRRIGAGQVGIERIFPLKSPFIEEIKVLRSGVSGVRSAKLYYIREKSKREIEKIYSRAATKGVKGKANAKKKKTSKRKSSKKKSSKK